MSLLGPAQTLRALRIIHLALIGSVVLYGVIGFIVTSQPQSQPHEGSSDVILYVLAGLAGSILLVALPMVQRVAMPPRQRVGDGRPFDVARLAPVLPRLRSGLITTWAMCESVAVCGLVGTFLYREPLIFLPFGGAAILALVYFAPRQSLLEEIASALPEA